VWSEKTVCPTPTTTSGRGRLEEFAETRPLFKDDPEKYIGMNPMEACDELGITLAQLVDLVNAQEDIFPNPRYKLSQKGSLNASRRSLPAREPITTLLPPAFRLRDSAGGIALGKKIGQDVNSEVSATQTSHNLAFASRSSIIERQSKGL
jgi:hypothetical protein